MSGARPASTSRWRVSNPQVFRGGWPPLEQRATSVNGDKALHLFRTGVQIVLEQADVVVDLAFRRADLVSCTERAETLAP